MRSRVSKPPYSDVVHLDVGLRGRVSLVVGDADTARALGSGTVEVLGTPRVVALAEQATVAALEGHLPAGSTSVGTRVVLDHLRATPVGASVVAEAVLEEVDGRRLTFAVSVGDTRGLVAEGTVQRAVVDIDRFLAAVH